ncbi:hypothetical protein AB0L70_36005 [Kribbella sp. NPDC051952]|uniref:hypothetical protein n=1 Tax=Kribbella sp. NPDC051952 TaxID=3154851 RepID=UPI0034158A54
MNLHGETVLVIALVRDVTTPAAVAPNEIAQGKNVADAAKVAGIRHLAQSHPLMA